ncbi:MAG: hypothetical protein D3923_08075 [Candidatus Electrothrix sp. AR3]|nr:hypothetical protein [Candidatus Electrothrix sp. AR3]
MKMHWLRTSLLTTSLILCMISFANADVVSSDHPIFGHGSLTIDTGQGLEFLDVTISINESYNYISTQFGACGKYRGFRFATKDEVLTLADNFGYIPNNYSEDTLSGLVLMLGMTKSASTIHSTDGLVESGGNARPEIVRIMDYPVIQNNRDQIRTQTVPRSSGYSWFGAFLVADGSSIPVCNQPPVANSGLDQSIRAGESVDLDGSASYDDNTPQNLLSYSWEITEKPEGSTVVLENSTSLTPTLATDVAGTYIVRLTVTDAGGLSHTDEVQISTDNLAPTANAGVNQLILINSDVQLDGTGSTDPETDSLTYSWTITGRPAGSNVALSDSQTKQPSFTPDVEGTYTVALEVSDFLGSGEIDTIEIVVMTSEDYALMKIKAAADIIAGLVSPDQIRTTGNKSAMGNDLTNAVKNIQKQQYSNASRKVVDAIGRTDGCVLRNAVDPKGNGVDWITDCAVQQDVYNLLNEALKYI